MKSRGWIGVGALVLVGCGSSESASENGSTGGTSTVSGGAGANNGGTFVTTKGGSSTTAHAAGSTTTTFGTTALGTSGASSGGSSSGGASSGGSSSGGAGGGAKATLYCPDPPAMGGVSGAPTGPDWLVDSRDGQVYPTLKFGSQIWMARNLNVGQMVPGIPEYPGQSDDTKIEKFCVDDVSENCVRCGGLYMWSEALSLPTTCNTETCTTQIGSPHRGICPQGWHIPTQDEWTTLAETLAAQTGYSTISSDEFECRSELGTTMKSTTSWANGGNGTNLTGFGAVPAGWRHSWGGFYSAGLMTTFHSANEYNPGAGWGRALNGNNTNICKADFYKDHSVSVRCVKD